MQSGFAMPKKEISTDLTGRFVDSGPCTAALPIGKSSGSAIRYARGETASPEGPRLNGEQFMLPTYWRIPSTTTPRGRDSEDTERCWRSRCLGERFSSE